jgi:hypothetical protein
MQHSFKLSQEANFGWYQTDFVVIRATLLIRFFLNQTKDYQACNTGIGTQNHQFLGNHFQWRKLQ